MSIAAHYSNGSDNMPRYQASHTIRQLRDQHHRIGAMIQRLADAERGVMIEGQEVRSPSPGSESMLVGELQVSLLARLRLMERVWLMSAQAIADAKPQCGDEVHVFELVRVAREDAEALQSEHARQLAKAREN